MKKILILLFTLAMCQGNLFGQTDNNTSNRFLKAQYFGKVGGNTGSIIFTGTTSGNVTLKSADIAGTWSLTLPSTAGTANYPLLTNGSGVTSWGVLPIAGGGTNISSYAIGDIIYASGATTLSKLPIGTASQQLRVNAGATALEYFTPAASGITVGTTTITSGTSGNIPYNNAGIYSEVTNMRYASGVLYAPTSFGLGTTPVFTCNLGTRNFIISQDITLGGGSFAHATVVGYNAGSTAASINYSTFIGEGAGYAMSGSYNTYLGCQNGIVQPTVNSSAGFGYNAIVTGSNQLVFGAANAAGGNGVFNNVFFNGVNSATAAPVVLNACGGSGTNNVAGNLNLSGGKSTGNATPGRLQFYTSVIGSSGTTLQSLSLKGYFDGNGLNLGSSAAVTGFLGLFNSSNSNAISIYSGVTSSSYTLTLPTAQGAANTALINDGIGNLSWGVPALTGYTVATLPAAGTAGRVAYVTDATAPTYLGALVGGGAVVTPVFDNGSAWVSY